MNSKTPLIDKILNNRLLTHVIFWIAILIFQSQVFFYRGHDFKSISISTFAILPSMVLASYILTYYQLPKLAYKKKYFRFFLSLLLSCYVFTLLARVITIYIAEPMLGIEEETPSLEYLFLVAISIDRLLQNYLLPIFLAPCTMAIIKLIKQRSEVKSQLEKLEKEKATSELNFLKTQIHPHFLLNTLNNIYALTLKKSDVASSSVLKLSEMLTYVLYKCNEKHVLLTKEIRLLENYISLEQLRYGTALKLTFTKNIQNTNVKIAPLILLSIVENAFKHGASNAIETPVITIDLKEIDNKITCVVFNTKEETSKEKLPNISGIGDINMKKQLDILYPNSYTYKINETEKTYEVVLTINLKKCSDEN